MILLDVDDTDSVHKANDRYYGSTVRLPESAAASVLARRSDVCSLPDYDTSEHQFRVQQEEHQKPLRFYQRWTFWRGVLFSLLLYAIVSVAIAVPIVHKLQNERRQMEDRDWSTNSLWSKKETSADTVKFDEITQQLETPWGWKNYQNGTCESFTFSKTNSTTNGYTTDIHSFLSAEWEIQGASPIISIRSNHTYTFESPGNVSGQLTVDVTPSNSTQENIKFFVHVNATSLRLSDQDNLCFRSSGSYRGLTIYLPELLLVDECLQIDITVLIPDSSTVPHFETYLPQFNHTFGDFTGIDLETLVVEGAAAPISFTSMHGQSVSVKNVLGGVHGKFNVTNDLWLNVIQGEISADVTLFRGITSPLGATSLAIDSGLGPINLNVTLGANTPRLADQNTLWTKYFATTVKSFDGAINLNLTHDMDLEPSVMSLEVQNALKETKVRLDPKFQGDFDVHSQLGFARVLNNGRDVPAVTGNYTLASQDRRLVCDRHFRERVIGWVGPEEHRPVTSEDYQKTVVSSVDIRSSIGNVTLDIL